MYVSNIVDSMLQKLYYEDFNVSFFKHYNTFSIQLKDINSAVLKSDNIVQILYHEYKPGNMQAAYQPFIDWIIALYNRYYAAEVSFEQFLENAGVYSLHRNLYVSYKENGRCERLEDVIPVETDYEKDTFINGVIGILNYVSQKIPLLIVLNKIHLAELSVLELVERMISKNPNSKIVIMASYNEVYTCPDYTKVAWNKINMTLEARTMVQDWNMEDKNEVTDNRKDAFVPYADAMPQYITLLNNMIEMGATEQALYYCGIINENINREKFDIDNEHRLQFFEAYAKACFYLGNYAMTLSLCDDIKKCVDENYRPEDAYIYNCLIALCHSCSGQDKLAMKFAENCRNAAQETGDEFTIFRSELLSCMVMFRCWTNIYLWSVEYDVNDKFLADAEKFKYYNHLAYIHLFCFGNDKSYYDKDPAVCESHEHFKRGMHYAELVKNDSAKLRVWKKHVVFSSSFGYYPAVDHFYKKSLDILEKQDNQAEKGNIYNGLGYNRIVSEEFDIADGYFNNAMDIWYALGKPENMGETLYNMSVNAMLARDYKTACELLVTAVRIMKNLNQNKLELCNMSKLYGMIALCYLKLGVEYNAQLYINKMQLVLYHLIFPDKEPSFFMWDDDMFFYYFNKGLLMRKDNLFQAQELFDKAKFHLKRTEGLWFFAYEMFAIEQADLYHALGRHFEANEILDNCLKYCTENGYTKKIERLNSALRGTPYEERAYNIGLKKTTVAQALALSRRVGAELQLNLKNKSISFLTGWQESMNRDDIDINSLIKTSMYTLQNHYKADKIIYIEMKDEKPVLVYSDKDLHVDQDIIKGIADYFTKMPNEFIANRLEKTFYDYKDIISLFGMNNIVSMIGIPIVVDGKLQSALIAYIEMHDNFANNFSVFLDNDLVIFNVASHQLFDAINRLSTQEHIKEMNVQLERSAVTDMLTGLYNRQGFAKTMEASMAKYGSISNVTTAVLYIDLDNFKYYNDTFGHDIGDVILVAFADMFKQITKDRGYAIRYGGDEFVIVITDSSEAEGVSIAKSIYKMLDETDGFADKLKDKMGSDFKIDPKNRVSCSIGIATTDRFSLESINEAMKHADDALYVVKKTTKHNYKVWSPDSTSLR